jgi:GTP pyrophosphokinase
VGYITKGRGVSVHRSDCPNVTNYTDDINRLIDVEWFKAKNSEYVAEVEVFANDRNGLFSEVSSAVSDAKGKINAINARVTQDRIAVFQIEVQLSDIDHLNKVIKAIRKVDSVYEVRRKK